MVLPLFSAFTPALHSSYIRIYVALINNPWTACETHFAPFYTNPTVTARDSQDPGVVSLPHQLLITRHEMMQISGSAF